LAIRQELRPRRGRRLPGWATWSGLTGASALIAVLALARGAHAPAAGQPRPSPVEPGLPAPIAAGGEVGAGAAVPDPEAAAVPGRRPARHLRRHAHSLVRPSAAAPAAEGCDPPYTLNAAGERQFKLRCLVDVRR